MCLIVIAWRCHETAELVLGANRDEFHDRAAETARFWQEHRQLCAGRDLQAGGTWLGVTRSGRFAAITNFRGAPPAPADAATRGRLTLDFLTGKCSPLAYLERLQERATDYAGFNLLLGQLHGGLYYYSNRSPGIHCLQPGVYGLSNHLLDTPWPKVREARSALVQQLQAGPSADGVLELLADRSVPDARELPDTGVGAAQELLLAPRFIQAASYGTRASTALLLTNTGQADLVELSFDREGRQSHRAEHRFAIASLAQ